jgi:multidrug efflux system membrane fusion protein
MTVHSSASARPMSRRARIFGGVIALAILAGIVWLAWTLMHKEPAPGAGGGFGGPGGGGRRGPASTVAVATATTADLP